MVSSLTGVFTDSFFPFPFRTRMEPREPSPPPTVFDMPSRDPEDDAVPSAVSPTDDTELSHKAAVPEEKAADEPWFSRYQNPPPKPTPPAEEPSEEASSTFEEADAPSRKFRYAPILAEDEPVDEQVVLDSLWHPPPPPDEPLIPIAPPVAPPAPEPEPEELIEAPVSAAASAPPVSAPASAPVTGAIPTASVPTVSAVPSSSSHVPLKPAPGSISTLLTSKEDTAHTVAPTPEPRRTVTAREEIEKAVQLGLNPRETTIGAAAPRIANYRRSSHLGKLLALTFLANLAALGGVTWWLLETYINRPPVVISSPRSAPAPAPAVEAPKVETPKQAPAASPPVGSPDEVKKLEASLKAITDQSSAQTAQTAEVLKRLATSEQQNQQLASRLAEVTATLATVQSALEEVKNRPQPRDPAPVSLRVADGEKLTPSQEELVLLKERNRLTSYADEAIATAAREPYERLWDTLADPRLADMVHAARAEILRVQNFYLSGSRIDRFDIPVATYFPEEAMLRDTQLKDDQLIKLLSNQKNPWEVRLKAANILGTRRSLSVGDALVEAISKEQNLDVMKEATFSFEQMSGYHAKLFDASSITKWWKAYKATPPPATPKPPKAPASAEPKSKDTPAKSDDAKKPAAKSSSSKS